MFIYLIQNQIESKKIIKARDNIPVISYGFLMVLDVLVRSFKREICQDNGGDEILLTHKRKPLSASYKSVHFKRSEVRFFEN